MDHPIPAGRPDLVLINKKKELRDCAFLSDHRVKIKESQKKDKYFNLAR